MSFRSVLYWVLFTDFLSLPSSSKEENTCKISQVVFSGELRVISTSVPLARLQPELDSCLWCLGCFSLLPSFGACHEVVAPSFLTRQAGGAAPESAGLAETVWNRCHGSNLLSLDLQQLEQCRHVPWTHNHVSRCGVTLRSREISPRSGYLPPFLHKANALQRSALLQQLYFSSMTGCPSTCCLIPGLIAALALLL